MTEALANVLPISVGAIIGLLVLFGILKKILYICNPNEILIFSGRTRSDAAGQQVGYRVIFGGRAYRIPILERVESMDMRLMPVRVRVQNAYSKGGTPLHIQAMANVKISNKPAVAGNAIERFLGRGMDEVCRVARETLEGNLRGVVATMTPEQVNEDRLQFAERISVDVDRDLCKLGLQLDTLKIQSVFDDVDYLESIGRKRIAMIIRDAEIAESDALREAETVEAECRQTAEVAATDAKAIIQQRDNDLRKIKADLDLTASTEEERTEAAAKEARARAEQELQGVRAELERLRLEADEVLPAEAARKAKGFHARGAAATLAENARAAAGVNDALAAVWREAGGDAAKVFLIQQLETIFERAAQVPGRVHLGEVHLVDSGDGKTLPALVNAYPDVLRGFLERLRDTVGIDVAGALAPTDREVAR